MQSIHIFQSFYVHIRYMYVCCCVIVYKLICSRIRLKRIHSHRLASSRRFGDICRWVVFPLQTLAKAKPRKTKKQSRTQQKKAEGLHWSATLAMSKPRIIYKWANPSWSLNRFTITTKLHVVTHPHIVDFKLSVIIFPKSLGYVFASRMQLTCFTHLEIVDMHTSRQTCKTNSIWRTLM